MDPFNINTLRRPHPGGNRFNTDTVDKPNILRPGMNF
jgi:hypothetical protein